MRLKLLVGALWLLGLCMTNTHSYAQAQAGGGFNAYSYEIAPIVGLNLPWDLWGVDGPLNVLGLRTALGFTWGVVELSGIAHYDDPDRIYTFDFGYRWDIASDFMNAFFVAGYHFSNFILVLEEDETTNNVGTVITTTDAGFYQGMMFGGGMALPLKPSTALKMGMRYYFGPRYWLLLEVGLGIRF